MIILLLSAWQLQGQQLTGTVIESTSGQPIEYATVRLLSKIDSSLIQGAITGADGTFAIPLPKNPAWLEISFVGFRTITIADLSTRNLGSIMMGEDSQLLDAVTVQAERSTTEFRLDRRVFNVGQDLTNSGATALEVLNNVPSVTVNIEGQIALRGSSGVQILVNGKPSVVAAEGGNALGTITADMIESVEVITNPSAKYDAAGTAGIINIILKKEDRKGLNGSVTLNTGNPNNHSLGLSVNQRTEHFNLFGQLGAGYRTFPADLKSRNRDLQTGNSTESEGDTDKNETFTNVILGTDYHIDDNKVISLTGHFAFEWEDEFSTLRFNQFDTNRELINDWIRDETTEATNPKWQYELRYQHIFPRPNATTEDDRKHELLLSAIGNSFVKDQASAFETEVLLGEALAGDQRTRTDFGETEYLFGVDYVRPVHQSYTLETGAQYQYTDTGNDFLVSERQDNEFVEISEFTNNFSFDQWVNATYATLGYEHEKWGLKGGLRLEHARVKTLLENTNEEGEQDYLNLFPSFHASYTISNQLSLQTGYSRRIYRPGLWELNPFLNIRNSFNIRTGNPELEPEYTDSFELTGIWTLGALSVNLAGYYRFTDQAIDRFTFFEDGINITRPANLGTTAAHGLELNAKLEATKWLILTTDLNYNDFQRDATLDELDFGFSTDQWWGRFTAKAKPTKTLEVEFTGNYQSGYETLQGDISGTSWLDFGARQKFAEGRWVLNLSIRDVFASRIFESQLNQPDFTLYNWSRQGRFIIIGLSYGFGKGEAMQFAGQKRF
ncbi:MAG: outer membrane beta-barrel family protein [Bacteroidota bacterium]